jgi:hypothetical protein
VSVPDADSIARAALARFGPDLVRAAPMPTEGATEIRDPLSDGRLLLVLIVAAHVEQAERIGRDLAGQTGALQDALQRLDRQTRGAIQIVESCSDAHAIAAHLHAIQRAASERCAEVALLHASGVRDADAEARHAAAFDAMHQARGLATTFAASLTWTRQTCAAASRAARIDPPQQRGTTTDLGT